ncbi:helix-turn-helix domain-containing protein [Microbacterium sp. YY-01]|uniref:helix-turn-helix domain-containing protein n=1 Tax=Microbacterium sp. YY-01 TaxID=3421634 RepID=UPI003D18590A
MDAAQVSRLLKNGGETPVVARTYRAAHVTRHSFEAGAEWLWQDQPPGPDNTAALVFAQGPVNLTATTVAHTQLDTGLTRGHTGFLHPHRPARLYSHSPATIVVVWLPWRTLEEVEVGVRELAPIAAPTPLAAGLRAFATSLVTQATQPTPYTDFMVERVLVEMSFGVLVEVAANGATAVREPRVVDRARSLMLIRREDPDFTVEELADELHISRRQLQRLFAAEDSSPADELRRMRVDLARELLADATFSPLSIEAIAGHAGFRTAAGLRRAFSAYGLPNPRVVRK